MGSRDRIDKGLIRYWDELEKLQNFIGFTDSKYSKPTLMSILQTSKELSPKNSIVDLPSRFLSKEKRPTFIGSIVGLYDFLEENKSSHLYESRKIARCWIDNRGFNEGIEYFVKLFHSWAVWSDRNKNVSEIGIIDELY